MVVCVGLFPLANALLSQFLLDSLQYENCHIASPTSSLHLHPSTLSALPINGLLPTPLSTERKRLGFRLLIILSGPLNCGRVSRGGSVILDVRDLFVLPQLLPHPSPISFQYIQDRHTDNRGYYPPSPAAPHFAHLTESAINTLL